MLGSNVSLDRAAILGSRPGTMAISTARVMRYREITFDWTLDEGAKWKKCDAYGRWDDSRENGLFSAALDGFQQETAHVP
jgi:hypothetical protein